MIPHLHLTKTMAVGTFRLVYMVQLVLVTHETTLVMPRSTNQLAFIFGFFEQHPSQNPSQFDEVYCWRHLNSFRSIQFDTSFLTSSLETLFCSPLQSLVHQILSD